MLEVTVFTLDLEFLSHLCRARARGCEVKVLLDLQQCLEPSCTHHAAALKALRVGNVAMRCPRFDAGGIDADLGESIFHHIDRGTPPGAADGSAIYPVL